MKLKNQQARFKFRLNVGFPFDIFSGRYFIDDKNRAIMNGGIAPFTGIVAAPNMNKSTLAHFFELKILSQVLESTGQVYDTELTLSPSRYDDLIPNIYTFHEDGAISIENLVDEERFFFYDRGEYYGENWWSDIKGVMAEKAASKERFTLPFYNHKTKEHVKIAKISGVEMDSMTEFMIEKIDIKADKHQIGDSETNMSAMAEMRAKSDMVRRIPTMGLVSSTFFIVTAHVGKEYKLDPYAVDPKKLQYLKGSAKIKHVPNQFHFLTSDLFYIYGLEIMKNSTTKGAEYPSKRYDDFPDNPDLQKIHIYNTRGKAGPTGVPLQVVVSQSEGIQEYLTCLDFCKAQNRFGLGGNVQNYFMTFYPDCKISRTTVRDKIREDHKLRSALFYSAELAAMHMGAGYVERSYLCTAEELYEDIKKLGYDWDELLECRQFYTTLESEAKLTRHFLSTFDLLRIRAGVYKPYWKS